MSSIANPARCQSCLPLCLGYHKQTLIFALEVQNGTRDAIPHLVHTKGNGRMAEDTQEPKVLTVGAQKLVEAADRLRVEAKQEQLTLHHWLLALLERHGPMAEALVHDLKAADLRRQFHERVLKGEQGPPLGADEVVNQAREHAHARGKELANEHDLAAVLLSAAGYQVSAPVWAGPGAPAGQAVAPAASATYRPRATKPTPALDFFGQDLTRQALQDKLSPLVGRDAELALVIETVCRRTKRNPVLVGPAGVGKTAIVEGLAQRIVRGEVPGPLRGVRLVALQPSSLVAGAAAAGELEKRLEALLKEAEQDGIILFIDEIHTLIGAGGMPGTTDLANQIKPALARGDLACIAATTDEEYRRFIETDAALERRFQPVRVEELTATQTREVLGKLGEELGRLRQVRIAPEVCPYLVNFADQYQRNRQFPDKAVDLLEQCVAHAVAQGKNIVEVTDAEVVAQRTIGMPLGQVDQLPQLAATLAERGLMASADLEQLVNRLQVTLRGLDLRPVRPNAVVLLAGQAAANAEQVAETVAEVLFGSARRIVAIDFGRFTNAADVSLLLGAPPGYIGYSDMLPMHRLAQMTWCVLLGTNLHACHPQVREVFTQALSSGYLTESRGRRIYLSDAIVILTADLDLSTAQPFGFMQTQGVGGTPAARRAAEAALGSTLVGQCTLVTAQAGSPGAPDRRRWFQEHLATDLSARFRQSGLELRWDETVIDWLATQAGPEGGPAEWERLVDDRLCPLLVRHMPRPGTNVGRALHVKLEANQVQVDVVEIAERKG